MFRSLAGLWVVLSATVGAAQIGSVQGTVKLLPREEVQPRLTPQYAGQPAMAAPFPKTPIPAVVFLKDRFDGPSVAPPSTHPTLSQKNAWFYPEVMAVLVGTTVDFPNLDNQYHNVFSYSKPKRFDLGRYPTGESRSVTFDKPGIVRIYCEIHEHMRAFVLVSENPFFAVTDSDGTYRIANVPVGRHTVVRWQPPGRQTEKELEVVAGQITTMDFP